MKRLFNYLTILILLISINSYAGPMSQGPIGGGTGTGTGDVTGVDDTPVDGSDTVSVSSNWAYDHVAAADPHTGYILENAYIPDYTPRAAQPSEAEVPIGTSCAALISSWDPNTYAGGNNYEVFRTGTSTWVNVRDLVTGELLVNTEAPPLLACVNPQDIYDNDSTNHVLVLDHYTSAAQTVTTLRIDCGLDPTTEPTLTFQYKAAGIGYGSPTTIEAVTTAAGIANVTTGIDDATVPAGSKIFVTFSDPDNAILVLSIKVELTKD